VTVELGTNRLVGQDPERIVAAYREVVEMDFGPARIPPLWDGRAAGRIVEILARAL
jgi:UDP-N-acetylglucosamine 2-epimerase (non-hydrolysing)